LKTEPHVPHLLSEAFPIVPLHVEEQDAAPGTEHPVHLGQRAIEVHDVVKDEGNDRHVQTPVTEWKRSQITFAELDIRAIPESATSHFQHCPGSVDGKHLTGERGQKSTQVSRTATQISNEICPTQ
jgi:hypothetical protein